MPCSAGINSASDTVHLSPVEPTAKANAPPGFEHHPMSHIQSRLQQPHSTADQSQAAMPASRAAAQHDVPAGFMSARDAAFREPAPRAAMPLPGEAAARQLQGSSAARTRLQERLAANEEVCVFLVAQEHHLQVHFLCD